MSSLLIQNGQIRDPSQGKDEKGDLLIEKGKISAIDKPGAIPTDKAERTIDASGKWVLPGLIDMHVHFREPGQEHKETIESGSLGAVAGGFTSVACMANTTPVNDTPYVTSHILEKARAHAACRVFPIGAVTQGLKGERLAEIGGMLDEGAVALSDDGMPVMNSYLMRKAMDYAKSFGVTIISHAEDINLVGKGVINEGKISTELGLRGNPTAAEEIMVARDIALCRLTGCPIHIAHLSSKLALDHVRRAKEEGLPVTAEVSPHHLTLTEDLLYTYDTHLKMAPPLRTEEDRSEMIRGLAEGVIDCIATDHAPHSLVEKMTEFDEAAFGIIGLETAIPVSLKLVHEGQISEKRWIEAMTVRPAQILGIPHGALEVGLAGDVTLIDPTLEFTFKNEDICSMSRNSPFLNQNFKGRAVATIVGGEVRHEK